MTNEDFQETYRINHIYKTEGFKGVINYAKDKLQQYGAVKEVEKGLFSISCFFNKNIVKT